MSTTTLKSAAHVGMLPGHLWQAVLSLFVRPADTPGRIREAAEVREMARLVQHSDPGFAADLYAAADRHELERD